MFISSQIKGRRPDHSIEAQWDDVHLFLCLRDSTDSFVFAHVLIYSRQTVCDCDVSFTSSAGSFPEDGRLPACVAANQGPKQWQKHPSSPLPAPVTLSHSILPLVCRKAMFPEWQGFEGDLGWTFHILNNTVCFVFVYMLHQVHWRASGALWN